MIYVLNQTNMIDCAIHVHGDLLKHKKSWPEGAYSLKVNSVEGTKGNEVEPGASGERWVLRRDEHHCRCSGRQFQA